MSTAWCPEGTWVRGWIQTHGTKGEEFLRLVEGWNYLPMDFVQEHSWLHEVFLPRGITPKSFGVL